jgi:hypothetical protein
MLTNRGTIVNTKDKEAIRQYRSQYPDALSFQNPDTKASLDFMLMEFKLEKIIEQCDHFIENKKSTWASPGVVLGNEPKVQAYQMFSSKQFILEKRILSTKRVSTTVPIRIP